PGLSQFYVSLEDDLMRLFRSERITKVMDTMGLQEGEVIQAKMITRSIGNAQKKVEQNNFAMRKRLLEYDDVMNTQREVVYRRRRNALYGDRVKVDLDNMIFDFCKSLITTHIDMTDAEGLQMDAIRFLSVDTLSLDNPITENALNDESEDTLAEQLYTAVRAQYDDKCARLAQILAQGIARIKQDNPQVERILIPFSDGNAQLRIIVPVEKALETEGRMVVDELEKVATLSLIDDKWKNHLRDMDELRQSAQNAVFEQKDPLLVYKFESYELFQQMLNEVNQEVLSLIFKADLHVEGTNQQETPKRKDFSGMRTRHSDVANEEQKRKEAERKVMAATGQDGPSQPVNRRQRRAQERKKGSAKRYPKFK
ncbi:MAG: preprotein translocase subunit SecA, partial [Bacteroidota bacterium]